VNRRKVCHFSRSQISEVNGESEKYVDIQKIIHKAVQMYFSFCETRTLFHHRSICSIKNTMIIIELTTLKYIDFVNSKFPDTMSQKSSHRV